MSSILLPRRRQIHQPQGLFELDPGNSFGVVAIAVPGLSASLSGTAVHVNNANVTEGVGAGGLQYVMPAAKSAARFGSLEDFKPQPPFSVMFGFEPFADSATGGFAISNESATNYAGWDLIAAGTGSGFRLTLRLGNNGGTGSGNRADFPHTTRISLAPHVAGAVVRSVADADVVLDDDWQTPTKNGTAPAVVYAANEPAFGTRAATSMVAGAYEFLLAADRALSQDEWRELRDNPYQVVKARTRRLYFGLPTTGGGDSASGGSSSTISVSAVGAGSAVEEASGGASSAVDVFAAGSGNAVESVSGGAPSGISVTSAGAGTAIEGAGGGASSTVDVTVNGAGVAAEIANGGNASLVEVSAAGAGTAAEQAAGGASSVVEITAAGAGAAQEDGAAVGGSSSIVDVIAVGAGEAAELAEGGSWSAVAVTAVGAGVAQEDGAAAGGSASRVEVVAAGGGLATEVVVGGSPSVVAVTAAGSGFKQEEGAQQGGSASLVAVLSAGSGVARERAFGGGAAFIRVRAFGSGIADDGTQIVLPPVSCTGSHLLSASAVGAHRRAATVTSTVEPIQ